MRLSEEENKQYIMNIVKHFSELEMLERLVFDIGSDMVKAEDIEKKNFNNIYFFFRCSCTSSDIFDNFFCKK